MEVSEFKFLCFGFIFNGSQNILVYIAKLYVKKKWEIIVTYINFFFFFTTKYED